MTMLNRYTAADISRFTKECEISFAFGPTDGYIYYGIVVDIELPNGQAAKEGGVSCFQTKMYSEDEVARAITTLWQALVAEGKIGDTGNPAQPLKGGITLTGNPLDDMLQVADALVRRDQPVH